MSDDLHDIADLGPLTAYKIADYRRRAEALFNSPFARGVMVAKGGIEPVAVVTLTLSDPVERKALEEVLRVLEAAERMRQAGEP